MKTLVAAVKDVYRVTGLPLEDAFGPFRDLHECAFEAFKGTRQEHSLLAAYQILCKEGYHFAGSEDREEFQFLIEALKRCEEAGHEGVQARRPRARKGGVRVRHRPRRTLSPQA